MRKSAFLIATVTAMAFAASPAFAHPGHIGASGLAAGMAHPLSGLDHILAMVAVGILAAQAGGRYLWAIPAAFLSMMVIGGAAGMAGIALPMVEQGIIGSVILLGLVIAAGNSVPAPAAIVLTAAAAIFHGHAHGTEIPLGSGGFEYAAGFVISTALLHASGIAATLSASKGAGRMGQKVSRLAGGAIACAGLALMAG